MFLITLLSPVLLDGLAAGDPQMVCAFAAAGTSQPTVEIRVSDTAVPGAMTGSFPVEMIVAGERVDGRVVPFTKTEARDVVLQAVTRDNTTWLVALRDDGSAVLRYKSAAADATVASRTGTCSDFERHMDHWLPS